MARLISTTASASCMRKALHFIAHEGSVCQAMLQRLSGRRHSLLLCQPRCRSNPAL